VQASEEARVSQGRWEGDPGGRYLLPTMCCQMNSEAVELPIRLIPRLPECFSFLVMLSETITCWSNRPVVSVMPVADTCLHGRRQPS